MKKKKKENFFDIAIDVDGTRETTELWMKMMEYTEPIFLQTPISQDGVSFSIKRENSNYIIIVRPEATTRWYRFELRVRGDYIMAWIKLGDDTSINFMPPGFMGGSAVHPEVHVEWNDPEWSDYEYVAFTYRLHTGDLQKDWI